MTSPFTRSGRRHWWQFHPGQSVDIRQIRVQKQIPSCLRDQTNRPTNCFCFRIPLMMPACG